MPLGPPIAIFSTTEDDVSALAPHRWLRISRDGDDDIIIDSPPGENLDPALLLNRLKQEGVAALRGQRGAFSGIARIDGKTILFRDATGRRPLYYRQNRTGVIAATDPFALSPDARPDWRWIADRSMMRFETGVACAIEGVCRVRPGEAVEVGGNGEIHRRDWRAPLGPALDFDDDELIGHARDLLDRATMRVLAGDTPPVAATLSGGLDSHLVAIAALSGLHRDELVFLSGAARGDSTPTAASEFAGEAARAAQTAQMLGLRHEIVSGAQGSVVPSARRFSRAGARPATTPDNLAWLDAIAGRARAIGADTLLFGDAGNFTYSWPGRAGFAESLTSGRLRDLARDLVAYRRASGASIAGMAGIVMAGFTDGSDWEDRSAFLTRRTAQKVGWRGGAQRLAVASGDDPGPANEAMRNIHGLYAADPFLDDEIRDFTLRLRERHFAHDGRLRGLARSLLQGRVPDRIVDERRRGAQGEDWPDRIRASQSDFAEILERARDGQAGGGEYDLDAIGDALRGLDRGLAADRPDEAYYRFDLPRALVALDFGMGMEA